MSAELVAAVPLLQVLVNTAEHDGRRWGWTGDVVGRNDAGPVRIRRRLDDSLVGGLSGIALALAAGSRALDGARAHPRTPWGVPPDELASQVARECLARVDPDPQDGSWGSGALGIASGAALTAALLGDGDLADGAVRCAEAAVGTLAEHPERCPEAGDLFGGIAGCLLGVLGAQLPSTAEELRRTVSETLCDRLMQTAVRDSLGARWNMLGGGGPVVGLAHGASGPALALAEWAAHQGVGAGEEQDGGQVAWRTVLEALRWESAWYDETVRQWRDPRGAQGIVSQWCYGGAGLGVAAARIRQLAAAAGQDDVAHLASMVFRRALRATALAWSTAPLAPATGRFDGTLCHGLAGAVEAVQVAADLTGDPLREHARAARCLAAPLVRPGVDGAPWACGVVDGGRSPSLFTGLSGVVLTLVRLHDRRLVPSPVLPGPVFAASPEPGQPAGPVPE